MRFYLLSAALSLLMFVSAAQAQNVTYFYQPEFITSISGRAFGDGGTPPTHLSHFFAFGQGANVYSTGLTSWNVGDFSGAPSMAPLSQYDHQRSRAVSSYGSSAAQIIPSQGTVGWMMNSFGLPITKPNYLSSQWRYGWNLGEVFPWRHANSRLGFEFSAQLPDSYMVGGTRGYVLGEIAIHDSATGKYFWWQPQVYDTSGVIDTETTGWDGPTTAIVNTVFSPTEARRYGTRNASSYTTTASTWTGWRWYAITLSKTQLLNIIADLNFDFKMGLSTDPANYYVSLMVILTEQYMPSSNSDGHMSMSVRQIYLYELY